MEYSGGKLRLASPFHSVYVFLQTSYPLRTLAKEYRLLYGYIYNINV